MRLSGEFKPVIFFYEKILSIQKRKSSQNQPTKTIFCAQNLLRGSNCLHCAQNLFVKKIEMA